MKMFAKVQALCKARGISVSRLERDFGFGNASVANWKTGTVPRADRLKAVADYFGVSVDYFMSDADGTKEGT